MFKLMIAKDNGVYERATFGFMCMSVITQIRIAIGR
jgi:hypothetical protein